MIPRKYALGCAGLLILKLKYRKKSVNYYQNYHNTTRKNYHQKNGVGVKKTKGSGFKGSRFQSNTLNL